MAATAFRVESICGLRAKQGLQSRGQRPMLPTQHRAMDATRKPFPPLRRASRRKCLANAVCAGLCCVVVAAAGTDLTTVEGVAVYSSASGGSTFYTLRNLSR